MSAAETLRPLTSSRAAALKGTLRVPGDKSISHRSLMFASQAIGRSTISGLLLGEDVLRTAGALRQYGIEVSSDAQGVWQVEGRGVGGFLEPADMLDMGNAGTGVRLMMGLAATHNFTSFFTGDSSLRRRPMGRVMQPLEQMGAVSVSRKGYLLPLALTGAASPLPITYRLPVPSAQVKSAVLLAGLNTPGKTTVIETEATRDHTERMLRYFGAEVAVEDGKEGRAITITGHPELKARAITVPGDPSSAAFAVVAALLIPGSDITLEEICINPLRIGLYDTLIEMGASIEYSNIRELCGEKVADIRVRASSLKGISVPAERAPSMIDEYPILAIAAANAEGESHFAGLAELKVKESNRLQAVGDGLTACGIAHKMGEDSLTLAGRGSGAPQGGGQVKTHLDHRIAMSFLVLGMVAKESVSVDDGSMIDTSFPGFASLMNQLGGDIRV